MMTRITENIKTKKDAVMKWHTQAGNITTNLKVKIYFTLPGLIATAIMTWKCNVDESKKSKYIMMLGRYLLT